MLDVSIKDLSFSYDNSLILSNVNMKIESGSFICLLGQSGCGKSTLLRLLSGLERPKKGEVLVDNHVLNGPGLEIGMVFQDHGLFPWMSAGENIMIALKQKYKDMSKQQRKEEAIKRIEEVGLSKSCFDKLPKELSGGMQQRCAIARAFSIDSPILLMDEPFGALDAVTRTNLQDLILKLWNKETSNKKTIFFVTHDVDEALYLATDIFVLGQSPSNIIYNYSFENDVKLDRQLMYKDPEIIDLRNNFIKVINNEVQQKLKNNCL